MARKPHFELFDKGPQLYPGKRFRFTFIYRKKRITSKRAFAFRNDLEAAQWLANWLRGRDDVEFSVEQIWPK